MKHKIIKDIKNLHKSNSMPEIIKDPVIIKKEKEWDNRFIYNKIPEYDALIDKNINKNYLNQNKLFPIYNPQKKTFEYPKSIISNLSPKGSYTQRHFYQKLNLQIESSLNPKNEKESCLIFNIKNLWDKLNVLNTYKELFSVVSFQLDEKSREDFFKNEIENLSLIKEKINLLVDTIKKRDYLISQLKTLHNNFSDKMINIEKNNELINNTTENIQNLRKCTIDLVNKMVDLRKEINYYSNGGKFDFDFLCYKFGFNKNYLIKMKDELQFLKDGYLKFFFNVNNDNSPFLLKASDENNDNNFIVKVPITEELREEIKKCQFIIYQDLIFFQNQSTENNNNNNKYNNINKFLSNSPMSKTYNNKTFFQIKKNPNDFNSKQEFNYFNKENNIPKTQRDKLNSSNSFVSKNPFLMKTQFKFKKIKNNNEEIKKAFENVLSGNKFRISFYKKSLNTFINKHYYEYYKKIPEEQINFFKLNQSYIQIFFCGISPCLILLKDNNNNKNLIGLCGLSYFYFEKNLTLNINHISTIDINNYKEIIQALLNYIKNKFYYDDIQIHYSLEENEKNNEIRDFLINENNFILESNGVLKFKTINQISNKIKKSAINLNKKIFSISNSMMITNSNQKLISNKIKDNDDKFINIVTYNFLISDNYNPNSIIENFYNRISKLNDLIKYFSSNGLNIKLLPISIAENTYNIKSCILNNSIFKHLYVFNSNSSSYLNENNGIYYNYIKPPFTIYYNKNKNCHLYQISNSIISLLICEINNELKEYLKMNNIYIQMNEIYKESINENNKVQKENCIIWIPCFEKIQHLKTNKITFSNINNNSIVDEYIKLDNKKFVKSSKKDYNSSGHIDKIPYLQIEPNNENDIIIKDNFIIGIINQNNFNQLEENNTNFPYIIFLSEISTKNFISA